MKLIITESQYNRAIDSYISYLLEPHEVNTTIYSYSVYWVKNGKVIVEIEKPEYFWLHYEIWNSISRMFDLDYFETKSIIEIWLEQHHNLGKLIPARKMRGCHPRWVNIII